jgi:hypothetical protein
MLTASVSANLDATDEATIMMVALSSLYYRNSRAIVVQADKERQSRAFALPPRIV